MIKVLIVNETRLICSVLGAALREEEDILVVGYASDIDGAVNKADRADVILVDDALSNNGAKKITELIAINYPVCLDQEGILEMIETLTPREKEVLDLVSEGLTNLEISEELYIEVGTVKNHIHNILDKLDVSNRHKAAKSTSCSKTGVDRGQENESSQILTQKKLAERKLGHWLISCIPNFDFLPNVSF